MQKTLFPLLILLLSACSGESESRMFKTRQYTLYNKQMLASNSADFTPNSHKHLNSSYIEQSNADQPMDAPRQNVFARKIEIPAEEIQNSPQIQGLLVKNNEGTTPEGGFRIEASQETESPDYLFNQANMKPKSLEKNGLLTQFSASKSDSTVKKVIILGTFEDISSAKNAANNASRRTSLGFYVKENSGSYTVLSDKIPKNTAYRTAHSLLKIGYHDAQVSSSS